MYRIGIDLGGTNIAGGLVDEQMQIVERRSVKTGALGQPERLADDLADLARSLMERRRLRPEEVVGVGVGVPCTAHRRSGRIEDPCRPGLEDVPLVELLEKRLGLPVCIENDANAAAWGEYQAGEYTADSFVMVTLGTGIGGGIILNGGIWSGLNDAAGEFGHMVIYREGLGCSCGRRGCFECYGSATALIRRARERMAEQAATILRQLATGTSGLAEAKTVFDAAAAGDPVCLEILEEYTEDLAEGFANIINLLQPSYLCIGGGVSHAGMPLLAAVRSKTAPKVFSRDAFCNTEIVLARLGNDAGIIGAALLGK